MFGEKERIPVMRVKKRISHNGRKIDYELRRSHRARHVRLVVRPPGIVRVSAPVAVPIREIEQFMRDSWDKILEYLKDVEENKSEPPFKLQDGAKLPLFGQRYELKIKVAKLAKGIWRAENSVLTLYLPEDSELWVAAGVESWYRAMVRKMLQERVGDWAERMGVSYRRISVKNQRTLWGSCSSKGNLNFNWRIALLPPAMADYLIVHELAHLIEANHSRNFWKIVEKYCPDYRTLRAELKGKGHWLHFP